MNSRPLCVALLVLAACSDPTRPDPLVVLLRPVSLSTEAELESWPSTPTVQGGDSIRVRGIALVGCAGARAEGERRGDFVRIAIQPVDFDRPCPANISPWVPFEATAGGLSPDAYRVRVTVSGHDGHAEWRVSVWDP